MKFNFSPKIIVSALIMLSAFISFSGPAYATGSAEMRLENEAKVSVPSDITEDVWAFLQDRHSPLMNELNKFGSDFSFTVSVEDFIDVYYDDSDFTLLNKLSGVRFRQRHFPNNPDHKKDGRRLVQIKLHLENESESTRGEIKFKVPEEVEPRSNFPHIGSLLRARDIPAFIKELEDFGVNPTELRPTLRIEQERRRIYISKGTDPFATITLDLVQSKRLWATHNFTEIEIELNEIGYTDADADQRKYMEAVMNSMKETILKEFPSTKINLTPKYNQMFTLFSDDIPMFKTLLKVMWSI